MEKFSVKIFANMNSHELEREINQWLQTNSDKEVKSL